MGVKMPLANAASRKLIHTRDIHCNGYERDDGLWDIEGQITDTKSYSFDNHERGRVGAGTPVHDMLVRLTVDDDLIIQKAEAVTESAPFGVCPEISPNVRRLEGVKISSGWTKTVREKFGGTEGCTHILHLILGPLATTAYQTIMPLKNSRNKDKKPQKKPAIIDTCHAFSTEGPIVKRLWPEFSTPE